MAASSLVDLVKIYATNQGTGALTLGEAVQGYRGVEALLNGATYSYSIQQDAQWEIGKATFLAADNQLVRTPLDSSNGGSTVDFQANAAIAFVALSEDILARDVLQPLYGFGPPLPGQGLIGQTYTDLAQPVTLYGPKTASGWGNGVVLQGAPGKPGTAASYETLDELRAADPAALFYVLLDRPGGTNYTLTPGDYTGQVDNVNVVKLDRVSLTIGALVRQRADSVAYQAPAPVAATRAVRDKLAETIATTDLRIAADTSASPSAVRGMSKINSLISEFNGVLGSPQGSLYVPGGLHQLTETNPFARPVSPPRTGAKIHGDGKGSFLWMRPDAPGTNDLWFYDNGAQNVGWGYTFRDMCFAGGNNFTPVGLPNYLGNMNARIKGFKFTGPNWESSHKFVDCVFSFVNDCCYLDGSNNADTIRFHMTDFEYCGRICYINNPQSLGISFSQCYDGGSYGTFLEYGPIGGGGNFSCTDSTIIHLEESPTDTYVVDALNGGPSTGNSPVVFHATRCELRGPRTKLIRTGSVAGGQYIFDKCAILNTGNAPKELVRMDGRFNEIVFRDTSFSNQDPGALRFVFNSPLEPNSKTAVMRFHNCYLPEDFHDNVIWENFGGYLEVEGCGTRFQGATTEPQIIALDCNTSRTTFVNQSWRRSPTKRVRIDLGGAPNTTAGYVVQIPPGSVIKKIYARIIGGTGDNYRMFALNGDGSRVYGVTPTGPQNSGQHIINADNIDFFVGFKEDTDGSAGALAAFKNNRLIRLSADNGQDGQNPAGATFNARILAYVEYL